MKWITNLPEKEAGEFINKSGLQNLKVGPPKSTSTQSAERLKKKEGYVGIWQKGPKGGESNMPFIRDEE